MPSRLRVHAIIIALNEEPFIANTIAPLYEQCSGISVISQYDRNYYGDRVLPDGTINYVLNHPDPEGKISLVVRRYTDEAVSRNHEMLSLCTKPWKGVTPHFDDMRNLLAKHKSPDYFLVVDADEIFDTQTFPNVISFLEKSRPRILKIHGYEYAGSWNRRVPPSIWTNHRIGFIRAGIRFSQRRNACPWENRIRAISKRVRLSPELVSRFFGILSCPMEVGVFHHGGLVRCRERLVSRANNHSEKLDYCFTGEQAIKLQSQQADWIPTSQLPVNIRDASWPDGLIDRSERELA